MYDGLQSTRLRIWPVGSVVHSNKASEFAGNVPDVCTWRTVTAPLVGSTYPWIDEPIIERFKLSLKKTTKTTANRYLATLRKALRYACRRLKLIDKTPVIELYKHDKDYTVERECEYVYSPADYQAWLAAAREPLGSASILAHDGGICRGELLAMQWDCVKLNKASDENGFWGTIEIRRGLKRKERRRDLPITEDMAAVLLSLKGQSKVRMYSQACRIASNRYP